jgi:lipooligosaccharide transport system permease protein
MQTATSESSWPLFSGFKWNKSFEAMIGTPQGVRDIVLGHLYWLIVRVGIVTGVFLVIAFLFGAVDSPTVILAWPAAILTGVAFGMPMARGHRARRTVVRLHLPLPHHAAVLFSAFAIEQLPAFIQPAAWLTPPSTAWR